MNKYNLLFAAISAIILSVSCSESSTEMDKNYNGDYQIEYALKSVVEKDPVNINGIDVYPYFDFFKSLRFVINVKDGKMHSFSYENGDIPFSPFSFDMTSEETECFFDTSVSPNVLRIKESGNIVAEFKNGEFYMPFSLDCEEITYEFKFKEITE